jgi:hypothetical protein
MDNFLQDPEKNIYEFTLTSTDSDGTLHFSIGGDFSFSICPNLTVTSPDDELIEFCSATNAQQHNSLQPLLGECTTQYGKIMGIELTPDEILEMGDEFDRDNELNDMKFVDRIRYNQDDFHPDLFSNIFEYLDPVDLVRFSRVCKSWQKLTCRDDLWKKFCVEKEKKENSSWREHYRDYRALVWDLTCAPMDSKFTWNSKTITGASQDSICRTVRTSRGCMPGQKMQFTIFVDNCSLDVHSAIGIVDSKFSCTGDAKNCFSHGNAIVLLKANTNQNITMIVDRTNLSGQSVKFYQQDVNGPWTLWKGQVSTQAIQDMPDPTLLWYPSVTMVQTHQVTIIPNPVIMNIQ